MTTATPSAEAQIDGPKAGRKEWIALGVLVLPLLLTSMDMTVLYFAVPSIAGELQPSSAQQLWMIDIYAFVLSGMLITMGNIGDLIGRRRLLMTGATLFGAASVLAAYANSTEMLILARALQGLGGATLMPSTLSLVSNMFRNQQQRRTAISIWAIGSSAGSALGPVISGSLLNSFWWGSIFLINIPVLAIMLVLVPLLVPEFRRPRSEVGRFDLLSAVLSLVGVLSIIWGLKQAATEGLTGERGAAMAVGLGVLAVFLRRQRILTHPMIDPQLFKRRGFSPAISLSLLSFACLIGYSVFTTQYLMDVLNMRPLEAALWTMPPPALTMLLAPFAVVLANRVPPAYVISGAFVLLGAGFVAMTQVSAERNLPLVIGGATAIGVGAAIVLTLVTDLVVAAAPPERAGSVSALTQTFQDLGGALGIAVFGSIGAAVYRDAMSDSSPAGVRSDVLDSARQTLGGAVQAAGQMAAEPARALLAVADHAFVDAMNTAAVFGTVVALATAAFTVWRLSHVRPTPQRAEQTAAEPAQSVA
ncbi:MFS transporter [Streptomyces agglomeratus]|uniref:MFS transporter n=1 Tax=Streptomyces agglomeratus TaxID=285458 RepID=UPI000854EE47|nr:MFS transporter [Streptomyces agglomeratus]OEJ36244.1 MFS transporter [Streptomyces agglomeratus]